MDEFDDHARSLLQALQEDDSPSAADAARIKQQVLIGAAVGAGAATATKAATAASSSSAATTAATSVASTGLVKALLVVAATGGLGGVAYSALSEDRPDSGAVGGSEETERPQPSLDPPKERPRAAAAPEVVQRDELEPPKVEQLRRAPSTPVASVKKRTRVTTDLMEEAALLQRAQKALQSGQPQVAISVLSKHQKMYPRGALAGEREAALAVAYCKSGDLSRGQAKAQRFIKNQPKSPMVTRLTAACRLNAP